MFHKNNNPMVYSANFDISKTNDRRHKIRNKYQVIDEYLEIEILKRMKNLSTQLVQQLKVWNVRITLRNLSFRQYLIYTYKLVRIS